MTTPTMADLVPGLESLRQVLTSPKAKVTAIEVEREVERRCSELELRYGAAALLQLKGGGREGCKHGHLWIVVGEGYACVLCKRIRS